MSSDPFKDFMDAYEPARSAQDWNAVVDAAAELARRTALEVLRTIGVDAPTGASPVALVLLAKEEAPSRNDRFINPEVLPTDRFVTSTEPSGGSESRSRRSECPVR